VALGTANGYGTVAVDLAKEQETLKALRKQQMDRPRTRPPHPNPPADPDSPANATRVCLLAFVSAPVAMKKNPVTGEMEEFHSEALQDDLPEEEQEDAEIEIPVGDDY